MALLATELFMMDQAVDEALSSWPLQRRQVAVVNSSDFGVGAIPSVVLSKRHGRWCRFLTWARLKPRVIVRS